MSDFIEMIRNCTSEEIRTIADAHGLAYDASMPKDILTDRLAAHLLTEDHMRTFLLQTEMYEIKVFEQALAAPGIRITEELVDASPLLTAYGIYDVEKSYYVIPDDVKAQYRQMMTRAFREEMIREEEFMLYCGAAVILYGVIPLRALTDIINHYEPAAKSVCETDRMLQKTLAKKRAYDYDGQYLIDKLLVQSARTAWMLKHQIDVPYYLPETKEAFLRYGIVGGRIPDQDTAFVMRFLEENFGMTEIEARLMYFELQRSLRAGPDDRKQMKLLTAWGCDLSSPEIKASVKTMLHRYAGYVRRWENRGYTDIEMTQI